MLSVAQDSLRSYSRRRSTAPGLGLALDLTRASLDARGLEALSGPCRTAIVSMDALEAGALANRDEQRAVGHYWLRAPALAPTPGVGAAIAAAVEDIRRFAIRVHDGLLLGADGPFEHVIHVGIGGSALGPQFLCESSSTARDRLQVHFLDNADPDGVQDLLSRLDGALGRTLVAVVSKSGITPTPMLVARAVEDAYAKLGLPFAAHAIAITMRDTPLDRRAAAERWLARFPLWEWVGGRTSVTSAVGLVPAALQGGAVAEFLAGSAAMDELTRESDPAANPAALLAMAWHLLAEGRGHRSMVVLPYRDCLWLLPRYVQQLVMESLGKRVDRRGNEVNQGLTVYGNKGVTDQHAYVQQLREGPDDCFVLFVGVQQDRHAPIEIGEGLTLGDYLFASLEGTRQALHDDGRRSINLELADTSMRSIGALVALLERAVGLYAELIDVNAYHQPGVDKNAATAIMELQVAAMACLRQAGEPRTAGQIACDIDRPELADLVFKLLMRLAQAPGRDVVASEPGDPERAEFMTALDGAALP